ncbi:MAG: cupredoxin domain-containing protein [Actinobacteria bacterium]|nr:cupredoxin domain-containing protein [Actinomycetota bacterium]
MLVVLLATGGSFGEDGVFLVVAAVLPLAAAALVWRFGLWAKVVALVMTLLAVGGLFWVALGLAFPASFGDFVPAVSFLVGFVLALGGSIAAIVRHRGTRRPSVERRVVGGASVLIAVAAVVSGALTLTSGGSTPATGGTAVTMSDFSFAEATYEVASGDAITLIVHNSDGVVHDIAIPELGVEKVSVLPGSDAVVEVPAPAAGTYTVYCTLHSNLDEPDPERAGMAALLVAR